MRVRSCDGTTGSAVRIRSRVSRIDDPRNGGRPSASRRGWAQRVLVGGGTGLLGAGGLLGGHVARRAEDPPGAGLPEPASSRLTSPKSAIFGVPSPAKRTFAGLMSRWTIPRRWATSMARARVSTICAASSMGCGLPAICSARLPPSRNSSEK